MAEWIRSSLDIILILLVGAGLVQATRLIWHLKDLRASRADMERFVRDFNAAVLRAEAGVKNLKMAAREGGDDLERLVGKSIMVRDELQFIVESADQLAERLTVAATTASSIIRPEPTAETKKQTAAAAPVAPKAAAAPAPAAAAPVSAPGEAPAPEARKTAPVTPMSSRREPESKPSSRAEKELMQALKKLN